MTNKPPSTCLLRIRKMNVDGRMKSRMWIMDSVVVKELSPKIWGSIEATILESSGHQI